MCRAIRPGTHLGRIACKFSLFVVPLLFSALGAFGRCCGHRAAGHCARRRAPRRHAVVARRPGPRRRLPRTPTAQLLHQRSPSPAAPTGKPESKPTTISMVESKPEPRTAPKGKKTAENDRRADDRRPSRSKCSRRVTSAGSWTRTRTRTPSPRAGAMLAGKRDRSRFVTILTCARLAPPCGAHL